LIARDKGFYVPPETWFDLPRGGAQRNSKGGQIGSREGERKEIVREERKMEDKERENGWKRERKRQRKRKRERERWLEDKKSGFLATGL
jgi:hypothetical protein